MTASKTIECMPFAARMALSRTSREATAGHSSKAEREVVTLRRPEQAPHYQGVTGSSKSCRILMSFQRSSGRPNSVFRTSCQGRLQTDRQQNFPAHLRSSNPTAIWNPPPRSARSWSPFERNCIGANLRAGAAFARV